MNASLPGTGLDSVNAHCAHTKRYQVVINKAQLNIEFYGQSGLSSNNLLPVVSSKWHSRTAYKKIVVTQYAHRTHKHMHIFTYIIISYNCRYRNLVPINNYNIWTYLFRNAQSGLEDKVADMERRRERKTQLALFRFNSILFIAIHCSNGRESRASDHPFVIGIFLDACHKLSASANNLSKRCDSPVRLKFHIFFFARNYWPLVTHVNLINVPSTFFPKPSMIVQCACNVVIFNTVCHESTVRRADKKSTLSHIQTDSLCLLRWVRALHNWQWINAASIIGDRYNFSNSCPFALFFFSQCTLSSAARIVYLVGIHSECVFLVSSHNFVFACVFILSALLCLWIILFHIFLCNFPLLTLDQKAPKQKNNSYKVEERVK